MDEKITIDDIARDLGVSKTTVSRAISGKGRRGDDTRTHEAGHPPGNIPTGRKKKYV